MDPSAYILSCPTLKSILFETSYPWFSVFLFLSAYGYAQQNSSATSFSLSPYAKTTGKRLGKLYSQYWFVFFFALILSPVLSPNWMDVRYVYGADGIALQVIRAIENFFGIHHIIYGDNVYTLNQTWWYISICILLILFIPIIIRLYHVNKPLSLFGALILSQLFVNVRYMRYLLMIVLGVVFSDQHVFERSDKLYRKAPYLYILLYLESVFIWYYFRSTPNDALKMLLDTLFTLFTIATIYNVIERIPFLGKALSFIGLHAGNIFLIHSFIYIYYPVTSNIIYSLKYDWLIWLAVMVISLAISLIIEWIKKILNWNACILKLWGSKTPNKKRTVEG